MRASVLASLLVLFSCAPALAQTRGVALEAFTPAGMRRVDVDVPEVDHVPERQRYAPANATRAEVLVDVLLSEDAPSARAAAAWFRETVSGELPEIDGLGDGAAGDAGLVAFVHDTALVVVRRITGAHDVLAIARAIDRAIAPASGALAAVRVEGNPQPGGPPARIVATGAIGMYVTVTGPGEARRTRDGWVVARSAPGPLRVHLVTVDAQLRRTERSETLP